MGRGTPRSEKHTGRGTPRGGDTQEEGPPGLGGQGQTLSGLCVS